jgi:hypothetical protein
MLEPFHGFASKAADVTGSGFVEKGGKHHKVPVHHKAQVSISVKT